MGGVNWERCEYCDCMLTESGLCIYADCPRPRNVHSKQMDDLGSIRYCDYCKSPLKRWREIDIPQGVMGEEKIVGIVNFRDDVIIATEHRVLRMSHDEFEEVKFEQVENR